MSGRGKGGKGLGKGGAKRHRKVLRDNIQVVSLLKPSLLYSSYSDASHDILHTSFAVFSSQSSSFVVISIWFLHTAINCAIKERLAMWCMWNLAVLRGLCLDSL
ncbi:histone H4 [Tanacetum coccineum]